MFHDIMFVTFCHFKGSINLRYMRDLVFDNLNVIKLQVSYIILTS